MTINPETNEATLHINELKALVNQNDKQANVLISIVNALKKHPSLFPEFADTEANADFFTDFNLAIDDISNSLFHDLKTLN